jgi:hypothetical protein
MRNIAVAFGSTDKIEVDVDGCRNMGVGKNLVVDVQKQWTFSHSFIMGLK